MAQRTTAWRILVAEDDELLADTVDTYLRDAGFIVVVAEDGAAALRAAQRGDADGQQFDALLTDVRMPHLDGFGLIRSLRADRPLLPVVVMSGYAPAGWHGSTEEIGDGPTVVLPKPARMQDVVRALHRMLNGA